MRRNRTKLINPFGKGIELTEPPERQLAHVVSGIEAWALDAVLKAHGEHIRLAMHDGWVSAVQLNTSELEAIIARETGFAVQVEETRIA